MDVSSRPPSGVPLASWSGRGRRGIVLLAAVLAVGAVACAGGPPPGAPDARSLLVWADEFNGPAGQLPDSARWVFDVGTDWGNGQLEFDTDRPENVSLDGNGNLAITARRESYAGSEYTSGRIRTKGLFERNGGRFEARIRLPSGRGIWPAFWLLGADIDEVGWPQCGEIDVMEFRGQEPSVVHGSLHGPGHFAGDALTASYTLDDGRFDSGFHVFAVSWTRDRIEWFVDGERYQTVERRDLPGQWVYDHPFFILLNVAVGGTFLGAPDDTTSFPKTMLVDWVRVYRNREG